MNTQNRSDNKCGLLPREVFKNRKQLDYATVRSIRPRILAKARRRRDERRRDMKTSILHDATGLPEDSSAPPRHKRPVYRVAQRRTIAVATRGPCFTTAFLIGMMTVGGISLRSREAQSCQEPFVGFPALFRETGPAPFPPNNAE